MRIVPDDVMFAKAAIIERSLKRVLDIYKQDTELRNLLYLDAMTLNVERACQGAIDLAMHVVAIKHLGMPHSQADAFRLLGDAHIITREMTEKMVGMCGFRNVLIHEYQKLEMDILHQVAQTFWKDFILFCKELGLIVKVE